MTSEGVFDKSRWPLQAPDLFWALSDELQDIGELGHHDENFAEYEIDVNDLPDGSLALNSVNALRNIRINTLDFPRPLRHKLKAFALCLGSQTLEYIPADREGLENHFTVFSGQNILPLFALDKDLIVRVFFEDLDTDEEALLPYKCIDCDGLLVRVKTTSKAFFIGACSQSIVSWDGSKLKVVLSQGLDAEDSPRLSEKMCPKRLKKMSQEMTSPHAKNLIEPNSIELFSSYKDLWSALPLSPELNCRKNLFGSCCDHSKDDEATRPPQVNNPESDSDSDSPFHLF